MPQPTLTFINGPTIRTGSSDASLVRSQLMRKQHQEKRLRIQIPNNTSNNDKKRYLPICQCANSKQPPPHSSSSLTRTIHPRHALPPRSSELVFTACPKCHGLEVNKARRLNLHQIAPNQADPFFPDDRKTTPNFDFLLHECVNVVFPTARPGEFADRSLQAYLHPDRSPMVMQSMFYSALLHLHVLPILRGIPGSVAAEVAGPYTIQRLRIKGAVLNQIRQRLLKLDSTNIHHDQVEDVIMSALYLASNEHLESIRRPEKGPFSPPFRTLQSMEYYGSCEVHPLHWQTVQHIIEQRGGISTIKLYGLGWLVSVSGVISAINTDCKPPFPLVYPDGKHIVSRAPLQAFGIQQPPRHVALRSHGFQQLALLHPPVKGTIIRVLLDLSEMAQALNHLAAEQRCGDRLLTLIGDIRLTVVHRLCSLPKEQEHPRPSLIFHRRDCTPGQQLGTTTTIYIIARRSALLYTVSVVIPLPQTSLLHRKMTRKIQDYMIQLGQCGPNRERSRHPPAELEILLWCSVIAGICADSTLYLDTRAWFVAQARNFCGRLGISTWEELLVLLQSFCWLDSASDEAGRAFWSEIGSIA